jgi:hypothetical protein
MRAQLAPLALALAAAPLTSLAAQDINTAVGWNGAEFVRSFGRPNTAVSGQSFTAPSGAQSLTSFSFWLSNGPSNDPITAPGDLTFQGYLMSWTGTRATGSPLYVSGVRNGTTSSSFVRYDFETGGTPLVGGAQYVAFLYPIFPGANATNTLGSTGGSVYAGGDFVFLNIGSDFSQVRTTDWAASSFGGRGNDLVFAATFLPSVVIPEPSTYALLGTGLLTLGGIAARRRKRAEA